MGRQFFLLLDKKKPRFIRFGLIFIEHQIETKNSAVERVIQNRTQCLQALLTIIYEAFVASPSALINLFRKLTGRVIVNEFSKWNTLIRFPQHKSTNRIA